MRYGGLVTVLALTMTGAMAACNGSGSPDPQRSVAATGAPEATDPASEAPPPPPPPAKGRTEKEENEVFAFGYSYPDAAAAIPGLRDLLDQRLDADKGDLVSSARSGKAEAAKDGFPYHAYERQTDWKVVTNMPGWLSLSAQHYEFSGGAHGMTVFDSLVWDRGADTARKPADLFTGQDALRSAIQAPFCDALDKQRAKKRGEPVARDSGQMFSECIDPAAQTLILGSTNRRTFDRIGVLVAPYEAGPYAEGSYEVTLPVTGKVMAALKPQYRSAFSAQP
ncbi:DUF4163 domain-containing protein [Novosphingobium sp. P6W]|uniref:DUF4163 domain-containing protein n=1 Tax=Novosphingobium sp. P6W TaxID=1609758 RepID=UPI0005C30CB8|nr:DUF4163 domain-containing protein [Novosphingobium sp. P6W]AXB77731.1 DUF3298/DUF4163 domain-containing protein [Novosphingobium sp. P6W]KIS30331.1 hypothetical protein TQ38_23445 [Novosphingobium sp. P6W]